MVAGFPVAKFRRDLQRRRSRKSWWAWPLAGKNKLAKCAVGKRESMVRAQQNQALSCVVAEHGLGCGVDVVCVVDHVYGPERLHPCSRVPVEAVDVLMMRSSMANDSLGQRHSFGRRAVASHHPVWSVRSPQDGRFTPQSGFGSAVELGCVAVDSRPSCTTGSALRGAPTQQHAATLRSFRFAERT